MLGALLGHRRPADERVFRHRRRDPRRLGSAHPRNAPYRPSAPATAISSWPPATNGCGDAVCEAHRPPRSRRRTRASPPSRRVRRNQDELAALLAPEFAKRSAETWLADFDERGVPCAPINTYSQVFADAHVQSMDLLRDVVLSSGAATSTVAFPVRMSGYEFRVRRRPPDLGEHTEEVFSEWIAGT